MDLTNLSRVKAQLWAEGGAPSDFDTLLEALIPEVSEDIEARLGRSIDEATFTHYLDGNGRDRITLPCGPLVSVTSVHSVAYSDAGDGSKAETLTEIKEYERTAGGLRSAGHKGLGWIRLLSGTFAPGIENVKVVYVAGWDALPGWIKGIATRIVCLRFNTREVDGLASKDVGEGSISTVPQANVDAAIERAIAPLRVYGFG